MSKTHVIVQAVTDNHGLKCFCSCRLPESNVERGVIEELSDKDDGCPHKDDDISKKDMEIAGSSGICPERVTEGKRAIDYMTSEN